MNKLIIICLLLTTAFTALANDDLEHNEKILTSYEGQVYNGSDLDTIITQFYLDQAGILRGNYVITEEGAEEKGILYDATQQTTQLYHFSWKDKYGVGVVTLLFSSDFNQFQGFWGTNTTSKNYLWRGKQIK